MHLRVRKIRDIEVGNNTFDYNKPSRYEEDPSYNRNLESDSSNKLNVQSHSILPVEPDVEVFVEPKSNFDKVMDLVRKERERQDKKWGMQHHEAPVWKLILDEEFGEVAKSYLENDHQNYLVEMIQSIAVMVAWAECEARRLSVVDIDIEEFAKPKPKKT